ncbi:MAG: cadherin-like domain-containing protein, partial [Burkholderiaceae bacterium]
FDQVRRELVFTGAPNANGMREFSFKVTDSKLSSPMVTIGVMLRPVNDAPVVNAIGFQMLEDGGATDPTQSAWTYLPHTMLLSGATDAEGDALSISKVSAAQTTGTTTPRPVEIINDVANQRIGLRAPRNYNGPVVFEFTVSDGHGGETTQKAYGVVAPVNDVPYLTASRTSLFVMNWFVRFESTTWKIDAWDPDANQTVKIGVARNPLRGRVGIIGNSTTPDPRGGIMTTATVASFSGLGNRTTTETAWLSATDSVGASAQISISFTGRYSTDPIVIDLGRDGFSFIDIEQSRVSFTVHGVSRRSAWIGAGEGILAYDSDQDGRIQRLDEIAFGEHVGDPGLSDLQALQNLAFDQNQDGVFDNNDAKWSDFYLWQDLNGNGVSDPGELKRLADAGIWGLFLNANVLNRAEGADVRVRGYTRVLMEDGRLLQAADVWLGLENPDRLNPATADPTMQQISLMGSDQFNDLLKQLANAPQQGNRAPLV